MFLRDDIATGNVTRAGRTHTGRINPRNLKSPYPADASALRALKRQLLARVGELAAGWNAGAEKLGVKLPAWVARGGSKRSSAAVINSFRVFRIILTNAVKYVTNVESYDRRIQSSINIQGKKMQRHLQPGLRKENWRKAGSSATGSAYRLRLMF